MGAEQTTRAGGSRFAATFGLLRQYVKEQGGRSVAPAVTMGLMPGADVAEVEVMSPEENKTMELFPQQAGTLKYTHERRESERAQLTIFYGGRVMVFDDFPADKAKELMQFACSCNPPPAGAVAALCQNSPEQPCLPDLPIARKASLQRFLEKRKSRLAAADPYRQVDSVAAMETSKSLKDDGSPWLGANSMLHLN